MGEYAMAKGQKHFCEWCPNPTYGADPLCRECRKIADDAAQAMINIGLKLASADAEKGKE